MKNSSSKLIVFILTCGSLAKLVALLLVASLVGSILMGLLAGWPDAVGPAMLTHFLIAAPLAVIIGLPAFFLLRRVGLHQSPTAAVLLAVSVASVPLLALLIPEVNRYGIDILAVDRLTVIYAISVIVSAGMGGIVFALGSRRILF
jgi:hypothetical protein